MKLKCLVAAATIAVAHGSTPKSSTSALQLTLERPHPTLAVERWNMNLRNSRMVVRHDVNESSSKQKQVLVSTSRTSKQKQAPVPPPAAPGAPAPKAIPKAPPNAYAQPPKAAPVAPPKKWAPKPVVKAAPGVPVAKAAPGVPVAKAAPPAASPEEEGSGGSATGRFITQLIFGAFYYFFVVKNSERLPPGVIAGKAARDFQSMDVFSATGNSSLVNILMGWCCSGPRAAHTFNSVGILNYWLGLVLMTCAPCCTLLWANTSTDYLEKLGGTKHSCIKAAVCSFLCSCCLITQDAEALDLILAQSKGVVGDSYGARDY